MAAPNMTCPICGTPISPQDDMCYHCGEPNRDWYRRHYAESYVYSACLVKPKHTLDRYIRYGKRKIHWSQHRSLWPPFRKIGVITNASRNEILHHRDFPISTNIVLGNSCNLRCAHCGYHGPSAPSYFSRPEEMSWNTVEKLMAELPLHHGYAKFGAFEEPLLYYAKFEALVSHLVEKDVGVHLTTNGTLIDSNKMNLLRSLRTLYISLDAANSSTYKRIRGAEYDKVLRNALDLASTFRGIQMGVSFIRQPDALSEEQAFIDYWLPKVGMVILYALLIFDKRGYTIDHPFLQSPEQRVVCSSPWLETYVMPNGDVSLCCQTLVMTDRGKVPIMGNLKKNSLSEIWNGTNYERYRAALVDENWSIATICRDCPLWAASYHTIKYENGLKITQNPTTQVIEQDLHK